MDFYFNFLFLLLFLNLFQAMFERDVLKSSGTTEYTPKMLTFYAHWSQGIYGQLSALKRTVEEFRDLDVNLYFGLVDITDDTADSRKSRLT